MTPFHALTVETITAQMKASELNDMEGYDPSDFLPEPQSLKSILKLPPHIRKAWLRSYREELKNLLGKKTFGHPTKYNNEKCLPVRVVYKTKLRSDGLVDKLKTRIAIRGDLDQGATDEDNAAPLASFRLLKIFLCIAAQRKRRVHQADYIGAYLQAKMDRTVYVKLPLELKELFPDLAEWFGVPLLLLQSCYGINSAGRLWAEELFGWYRDYGFIQSKVEPSLFTYNNGDDWITLLCYCDDTAYFASSDEVREAFEKAMCTRFECKLLGQLHWFLRARITQHQNYDITLDQSRYSVAMIKRFLPNYDAVTPSQEDVLKYAAPLPNDTIFTKDDCSVNLFALKELETEFQLEYPVVIGCLLWILNTYPRLQFAIRKLAKYMRLPGRTHFRAVQHLLHHIRCNHTFGLTYYSNVLDSPLAKLLFSHNIDPLESPLHIFADSSWQDCPDTGRSTGGYHIFLQGNIVDSAMTFPVPVALSSAEAEYNNTCAACVATNSLAMLYNDINGRDPDTPLNLPIILDNTAAISMGESFRDTKHTRHILRRYHFVRWMIEQGRAHLTWIATDAQLADPATKCLLPLAPTMLLFRAIVESKVAL